jgi:hypothetical protein
MALRSREHAGVPGTPRIDEEGCARMAQEYRALGASYDFP